MGSGGKRKGAGRKPLPTYLKKEAVRVSIERFIIDENGGIDELTEKLYNFAKNEVINKATK